MPTSRTSPRATGLAVLALGAALAVTLTACGTNATSTGAAGGHGGHSTAPATTTSPPASAPVREHNTADVTFVQGMIPHHEQAVQMAQLAAPRAAEPKVQALAAQIKAAQGPEITTLKGWLTSWGEPTAAPGTSGHTGHGTGGMMSEADMATLAGLSGQAFDREFLTRMTEHHRGAIEMARAEQTEGRYGPAKQLAADIVRSQSAEIAQMAGLLKRV